MHYLAVVNGGIDQNSRLARKLIGHNSKFELAEKSNLGVQEYFQNVCGFSYVSNCTTSEMEPGFQQILKLEKTVKSNWLGQEIHSK